MKILMLLFNPQPQFDTRVQNEIDVLLREHEVKLLVCTRKVTPKNAMKFYVRALKEKPDAIHCHDLDTLLPGLLLKLFRRCRLTYDSHELYIEMARHDNRRKVLWILKGIEWLSQFIVDDFITVSDWRLEWYKQRYKFKRMWVIWNI